MKRTVAVILLLTAICIFLVGCTPKFDLYERMDKMVAMGYVLAHGSYDFTKDNASGKNYVFWPIGNRQLNNTMDYTYRNENDTTKYTFVRSFINPEQAKYYGDYMEVRTSLDIDTLDYKVAIYDCTVIITNDWQVMKLFPLKFK